MPAKDYHPISMSHLAVFSSRRFSAPAIDLPSASSAEIRPSSK